METLRFNSAYVDFYKILDDDFYFSIFRINLSKSSIYSWMYELRINYETHGLSKGFLFSISLIILLKF